MALEIRTMTIVQDYQYSNSLVCHRVSVPTRPGGGLEVKPGKITGFRRSGRGPAIIAYTRYFCPGWYHYLSIVQINPLRPSPNHSRTECQPFRYSVKIFSWPTLAGGGGGLKFGFFHMGLSRRP
jgi:hypothetical protein